MRPRLPKSEQKEQYTRGWVLFLGAIFNGMFYLRAVFGVAMARLAGDLRPICARFTANSCLSAADTEDDWECC
jgi:hypothetical protein